MSARPLKRDTGMGVSFIFSTVIHLTVFLLLALYGSHSKPLKVTETYYVDVVNLPVASPRSGSPSQKGNDSEPAPPPPKASEAPMALPAKPKAGAKVQITKPQTTPLKGKEPAAESATEFAERMAKLERQTEARQQEARMASLQEKNRNLGSGRAGMPGASGKEAGSDYMAYVQSRLKDAFQKTISHSSQKPEMTVRLFIDTEGKLARKKIDRSSGDRTFEISVLRAIDVASEHFTPPPGHKFFEGVFVFRREGILPNKP
ncbi:MAG: TonB C-terminal domain-containing protein [Desulfuromonadales bacterium]|nr:TonB C-terminal domain-containing protein [Desulfuromonadales bacterium]